MSTWFIHLNQEPDSMLISVSLRVFRIRAHGDSIIKMVDGLNTASDRRNLNYLFAWTETSKYITMSYKSNPRLSNFSVTSVSIDKFDQYIGLIPNYNLSENLSFVFRISQKELKSTFVFTRNNCISWNWIETSFF